MKLVTHPRTDLGERSLTSAVTFVSRGRSRHADNDTAKNRYKDIFDLVGWEPS